ncbi:unnamed protein product [Kuraishia capsulata CBS 1993]|uniref:SEC7 domain-containing protein n=1 Tax=Kuraishia capsulata CBS 1993 TaxID=1382522 RepID=W6MGX8_9ASCO|nr:uncharacterized protein KUCA_T00000845001 [Kuraishia capsulata CBS 1993]CDK24878.1 unnamed protein product [Kuraishia capsulata CBS 1993]
MSKQITTSLKAMDPLSLVIYECTIIVSAMRKTTRWSQNGVGSGVAAILGGQFNRDSSPYVEDDYPTLNNIFGLKNSRFDPDKQGNLSYSAVMHSKFKDDNPFLSAFIQLRSLVSSAKSLESIDSLTLLQPFLVVIRSPVTSAHVTTLALNSISRFLRYNIINENLASIEQTLPQIVSSLSHCKFEGVDQSQDEVLLMKVLTLIEAFVKSDMCDLLPDEAMYEAITTCFSLSINSRRKELLRRAAEVTLTSITVKLFERLRLIAVTEKDHRKHSESEVEIVVGNEDHSLPQDTIGGTEISKAESKEEPAGQATDIAEGSLQGSTTSTPEPSEKASEPSERVTETHLPFGVPCIKEFLVHTVGIIAPENQFQYTESSRIFALELLTTVIEVSSDVLPDHPEIFALISDSTCHHLAHIIQSSDSPSLLQSALQLFITLTISLGSLLKIQVELILNSISKAIVTDFAKLEEDLSHNFDRVMKMGQLDPDETNEESQIAESSDILMAKDGRTSLSKEILVEAISILWIRTPTFFANLFKLYDCDFDRSDVCENLIRLLCRLSLADTALFTTDNVPPICLEGLLSFVNGVHEHVRILVKQNTDTEKLKPHPLVLQKEKKKEFIECTKLLNENPKKGLAMLNEKGFIKDLDDLDEVAHFLHEKSGRVDKKMLGELLAKPANAGLLKQFLELFEFSGLRVDEALRVLLKSFRLPGESQQIERIVETFSERYVSCQTESDDEKETARVETLATPAESEGSKVVPDKDAVFVLSYSIIMLNTDLHNPQVKQQMKLEEYQRNLRGVYNGKDFPAWYLEKIYFSIKEREIIIPEEHHGSSQYYDLAWKNLIAEQESKEQPKGTEAPLDVDDGDSNNIAPFDKIIFKYVCGQIVSALISIFEEAADDQIITKMMATIDRCATIATYYGMVDIVETIAEVLAHMTTLTGVKKSDLMLENAANSELIPTTEVKLEKEGEIITVSEVSVWFGRDFKAQLCTVVLFRVLKKNNWRVSKAWEFTMRIIFTLFENCLLEPDVFPEFQKKYGFESLPKPKPEFQINRSQALKESGLFSTFSSYLKGLSDDRPEPTDEEIESTLSTIDCIKSSSIVPLFGHVAKTDSENIKELVSLLLESFPPQLEETARFYVSECLFILEISVYLCTLLTEDTESTLAVLKKCASLIEISEKEFAFPPSAVIRVSVYQLILLKSTEDKESLVNTITTLHTVVESDREAIIKSGTSLLKPLEDLMSLSIWSRKILVTDVKYWTVIRVFASSPKYVERVYAFLEDVLGSKPSPVVPETYMQILGLLDEISAVGAYGAQWEQEYEKLMSTGHTLDQYKNPFKELVSTALKSINLTLGLSNAIAFQEKKRSSEGLKPDAEAMSWYPLIEAVAHQCYNPCRQLRAEALKSLRMLIVSNDLGENVTSEGVIDVGCMRLLVELLKPEVEATDPNGMIKTQSEVIKLTCETLLNYNLAHPTTIVSKFLKIVSKFLVKNAAKPAFKDQTSDSLKNMFVIMKDKLEIEKITSLEIDESIIALIQNPANEPAT